MIDLHVIQNCAVMRDTISTCHKYVDVETTPFIVLGSGRYRTDDFENIETVSDSYKSIRYLYKRMKAADRVHVHGLFSFPLILLLAFCSSVGKKTLWYIFGDDLYCLSRPKNTIKNKIHLYLRKRAYRNISSVATTVRGDYLLLKQIMQRDYTFCELRYGPGSIEMIEPYISEVHKHDKINVLIGNSATRTNHHIDVFEKIKRIVTDDFEVYVPLSYGDTQYAEEVIEAGKTILGLAFHPMTELLPQDEYFRFLASIDVAVFACDRQQAMGNILALLFAGAKVYLRNDTSMWNYFANEYGIAVFDYGDLDSISEADFKKMDFDLQKQRSLMRNLTDEKKLADNAQMINISAQKK